MVGIVRRCRMSKRHVYIYCHIWYTWLSMRGVSVHFHKVPEDPLQDLVELSKSVSIGLSAEQLKARADEERLKTHLRKR